MDFKKGHLLKAPNQVSLCGKGRIWFHKDGKAIDVTENYETLGIAEPTLRQLGGQEAVDHYRVMNGKAKAIEAPAAEVAETAQIAEVLEAKPEPIVVEEPVAPINMIKIKRIIGTKIVDGEEVEDFVYDHKAEHLLTEDQKKLLEEMRKTKKDKDIVLI